LWARSPVPGLLTQWRWARRRCPRFKKIDKNRPPLAPARWLIANLRNAGTRSWEVQPEEAGPWAPGPCGARRPAGGWRLGGPGSVGASKRLDLLSASPPRPGLAEPRPRCLGWSAFPAKSAWRPKKSSRRPGPARPPRPHRHTNCQQHSGDARSQAFADLEPIFGMSIFAAAIGTPTWAFSGPTSPYHWAPD